MSEYVCISIGPVQGFVAQSRRTRDLWGSSYLLSFLAAQSIHAALQIPRVELYRPLLQGDPMLEALQRPGQVAPPRTGSVPNIFTFKVSVDQSSMVASKAIAGFNGAWRQICDAVWDKYVKPVCEAGNGTEEIWQRQTEGFWEISWVAGENAEQIMRVRKLWRTHWLPEEPGDKCTMMPELQELSGWIRAQDADKQNKFWETMRNRILISRHDLEDNERLSAIALIKRLFSRKEIIRQSLGWNFDLDVTNWPSTVAIAAEPWCRHLFISSKGHGLAARYAANVIAVDKDAQGGGVEYLLPDVPKEAVSFAKLDANYFYQAFVKKEVALLDDIKRKQLLESLKEMTELEDESEKGKKGEKLGGPSSYYALLLADGDLLGKVVRKLGSEIVSAALSIFTAQVPKLVKEHHGITVYAGGDDVFALLPIDKALRCALVLEEVYRQAFERTVAQGQPAGGATLSAAVLFAHARQPLRSVIIAGRDLLDNVAKKKNGRHSVAVGIYRANTSIAKWASTWQRPLADGGTKNAVDCLEEVVKLIEKGMISRSLLYSIINTVNQLSDEENSEGNVLEIDVSALLCGEIGHSLVHQEKEESDEKLIQKLAQDIEHILYRSYRDEDKQIKLDKRIDTTSLTLAAFLAGGGREEDHLI